ncbi:hypothetical protein SAMN05421783_1078 [Thiocapsa roseopersicina]|uniref:Uncharacterized protein n=1 Tax=Thiocapsa roseopersicina TaxID=1058 RepID=A0A1H2VG76_THIRO|nr:hypothetical protein SAMN05421783_1078 [Thiocapsa roseopersicina]
MKRTWSHEYWLSAKKMRSWRNSQTSGANYWGWNARVRYARNWLGTQ